MGLIHAGGGSSSASSEELYRPDSADSASRRPGRLSRDERVASELRIPFGVGDIINSPMDEFNDLLASHNLTEEQINLCRDIRRRGKNKVRVRRKAAGRGIDACNVFHFLFS